MKRENIFNETNVKNTKISKNREMALTREELMKSIINTSLLFRTWKYCLG